MLNILNMAPQLLQAIQNGEMRYVPPTMGQQQERWDAYQAAPYERVGDLPIPAQRLQPVSPTYSRPNIVPIQPSPLPSGGVPVQAQAGAAAPLFSDNELPGRVNRPDATGLRQFTPQEYMARVGGGDQGPFSTEEIYGEKPSRTWWDIVKAGAKDFVGEPAQKGTWDDTTGRGLLGLITRPQGLATLSRAAVLMDPVASGNTSPWQGYSLGNKIKAADAAYNNTLYGFGKPLPQDPYTLGPGQVRYDQNNKEISRAPFKPEPADKGRIEFIDGVPYIFFRDGTYKKYDGDFSQGGQYEVVKDPYGFGGAAQKDPKTGKLFNYQSAPKAAGGGKEIFQLTTEIEALEAAGQAGTPQHQALKDRLAKITHIPEPTKINVETRIEGKVQEKWAESDIKHYEELRKAADSAYNEINMLHSLRGMLGKADTNPFAEIEQAGQEFLAGINNILGWDLPVSETLTYRQAAKSISNKLALIMRNPDSGMGMPGAVSERDLKFLKDSIPNITNSGKANDIMVDIALKLAKRKVDIFNILEEERFRTGGVLNFAAGRKLIQEYAKNNPLFDDLEAIIEAAPPAPPSSSTDGWSIRRKN